MAEKPIIPKEDFLELVKEKEPRSYQIFFNEHIEKLITTNIAEGGFTDLKVFVLGSLGLNKLCLYSDVDLLVIGESNRTQQFSSRIEKQINNLKIRHVKNEENGEADVFTNTLDDSKWNVFDHYSLLYARALDVKDKETLEHLKKKTQEKVTGQCKTPFLEKLLEEKRARTSRYGRVAGLLQPNLKFGRGGLRDITQALGWLMWWEKPINNDLHILVKDNLLDAYSFLSSLRFAIHTLHNKDYVTADMWKEALVFFPDFSDVMELQKQAHRYLNEVRIISGYVFEDPHFYQDYQSHQSLSEWVNPLLSPQRLEEVCQKLLSKTTSKQETLLLRQEFKKTELNEGQKQKIMTTLHELFKQDLDEAECAFLFDSYILPSCLPVWKSIEGRPQSGHYHQYTVDVHLQKTLVAVCRLQTGSLPLYKLTNFLSGLTDLDWVLLKWTALFHDLAKGLEGDHSTEGARVLKEYVSCPAWSSAFHEELIQMVEYHLLLSKAAFRYDHNDAESLQSLNTKLKNLRFFKILTLFTAADISASNPEAWNEWKADQFYLLSESYQAFVNNGQVNSLVDMQGFQVLASLVQVLGEERLRQDIATLLDEKFQGLSLKVILHDGRLWVRVHEQDSGPGVLVKMLALFFHAGLSIEQAFICGNESQKVAYNWFRLSQHLSKTQDEVLKTLNVLMKSPVPDSHHSVRFENIKILSDLEGKWVFLFKGLDQKGLLLRVSQIFRDMKLNVLKAQVNTWGESVEDVFVVEQREDLAIEEALAFLKRELIDNYWH